MRCCVASCKTNKSKTTKISLFGIPKTDSLRLEWEKALGVRFKASSRVCRNHFNKEDIIDTWVSGKGLSKYTIDLKKPTLRKGAIPIDLMSFRTVSSASQNFESSVAQAKVPKEYEVLLSNIYNDHCYYLSNGHTKEITSPLTDDTMMSSSPERIEVRQISHFKDILNQINILNIPKKWYYDDNYASKKKKMISFHKLGPYKDDFATSIEKQLILTEDLQLLLYVYNKKINTSDIGHISELITINTYDKLLSIIKQFDETLVCQGALPSNQIDDVNSSYGYQFVESYGMWRHIKCCIILTNDDGIKSNICLWCKRLCYIIKNRRLRLKNNQSIRVFFSPNQQKKLKQIKAQKNLLKKKYCRAKKRINFLQNQLNEIKKKAKEISQCRLEELLDEDRLNMSMYQFDLKYESDD
ncbi:uncharacterized protein LOC111031953 [Myzus persicae]|uniref:uncharacterized protein LOC111031953 n=1 Tax=Myzus persicae TaxID=13164 RepID=UPI000B931157|nr:uncharacterized protein LOC111031953 [Myzus persicae]